MRGEGLYINILVSRWLFRWHVLMIDRLGPEALLGLHFLLGNSGRHTRVII
jgi:hypothetical protein